MMPIGALIGGAIILVAERVGSREMALRLPWIVAGAGSWCCSSSLPPHHAKIELLDRRRLTQPTRSAAQHPQFCGLYSAERGGSH